MTLQVGPAEVPGGDRVFVVIADQDITLYAVVINAASGDNTIDMPTAAGAAAWGFAQESVDYSEGQHHCKVRTMGFSLAIAFDGDIAAGEYLQIGDTSGRVDTAAAGDYIVARACEASAAQDDLIVVQVLLCGTPLPGG